MTLEEKKNVFRAMIITSLADGVAEHDEALLIREIVRNHPEMSELGNVSQLGIDTAEALREKGLEEFLGEICDEIKARATQELAFTLCARVMRADGETDGEEAMALGTMQERFGFSNDDVKRLLAAAQK